MVLAAAFAGNSLGSLGLLPEQRAAASRVLVVWLNLILPLLCRGRLCVAVLVTEQPTRPGHDHRIFGVSVFFSF